MPLPYTYFVKTTTIQTAPSDSVAGVANGRDPGGYALVNASYDHTGGGTGERQLTAASGTPFVNAQAGDYIYLLNAAGGVATGLYAIATASSSTVVLLAADAGLTADSTADVDSSDGPWATLQYAFDQTTATGNRLVICDDGNGTGTLWEPSVTLDIDTNAGGIERIWFQGANSRGVVDGTIATISGASLSANINILTITTVDDLGFFDLRFTAATGTGSGAFVNNGCNGVNWTRCRFDTNGGAGLAHRGTYGAAIDCEMDGNGTWGYYPTSTTTSASGVEILLRCRVHDNASGGLFWTPVSGIGLVSHCLIYDNGGPGVTLYRCCSAFDSNVIFGNTGDGIDSGSSTVSTGRNMTGVLTNNIFRSNGGYGVDWSYATDWAVALNNCFSNNTSGATGGSNPPDITDATNITTDPTFVSETDGSEDFDTQSGSGCRATGLEVPDK